MVIACRYSIVFYLPILFIHREKGCLLFCCFFHQLLITVAVHGILGLFFRCPNQIILPVHKLFFNILNNLCIIKETSWNFSAKNCKRSPLPSASKKKDTERIKNKTIKNASLPQFFYSSFSVLSQSWFLHLASSDKRKIKLLQTLEYYTYSNTTESMQTEESLYLQ